VVSIHWFNSVLASALLLLSFDRKFHWYFILRAEREAIRTEKRQGKIICDVVSYSSRNQSIDLDNRIHTSRCCLCWSSLFSGTHQPPQAVFR
jgi:hypothetical protein